MKTELVLSAEQTATSHFALLSLCTSPVMQELLGNVRKVARRGSVMIQGESGSGKELVANAIHELSPRSKHPFVVVNCGNQNSGIMGSELFGHEKGSFTSAHKQHLGFLEQADKGTVFFDEIGELPLELQTRLLRVLETKKFNRVGGSDVIESDFRVISATNRNLASAVATGSFREDLYFRLNVFPIQVPPLRTRMEDIAPLAQRVLKSLQGDDTTVTGFSDDALVNMVTHTWPGNVRELRNVIERSLIIKHDGTQITSKDLMFDPTTDEKQWVGGMNMETLGHHILLLADEAKLPVRKIYEGIEGSIVERLLRKKVSRGKIAQILGIDPATLYRLYRRGSKTSR